MIKFRQTTLNIIYRMKENKKAILEILKKNSKKDGKFENLVLNLALQKIDSDSFEYDGNAVYTNDKKRLVYCMSQETSFTIPEGVEIIGEMAFRGKKALKNVIIANSVKEIEHDAFYDCDELDNVYVPAGVKVVRSYAFAECDNLKKVTFAGTPEAASSSARNFTLSRATPTISFWRILRKRLKSQARRLRLLKRKTRRK